MRPPTPASVAGDPNPAPGRERDSTTRACAAPASLATYVAAVDGSSLEVSPRFERLLGYADGMLRSAVPAPAELIHPDDAERVRSESATARSNGTGVRMEYRL